VSDELQKEQSEVENFLEGVATSTEKGKNRFFIRLYLRVHNSTLRPVERRRDADYITTIICEYPTYEEELQIKKNCTTFDEYHSVHLIDHDKIAEWRLRRCIVNWDLHKKIPGLTKRLHRKEGLLTDDTFQLVLQLPPVVRKLITNKLWEALGPA
jgi:hypothetical protein